MNRFALGLALLCLALPAAAGPLTIGSKAFPESQILGEVLKQTAEKAGVQTVGHRMSLGSTGIVYSALKTGSIDVYPEYTGTISQELLKDKTATTLEAINAKLAPEGLAAGVPLGFNDGYGIALREEVARGKGVRTLSDLAKHPELRLGLSQEFLNRADGWEGLKAAYALPFAKPQGFDHGASYVAIGGGQIDAVDVYTTDAQIAKYHLRVLEDDRRFFPRYDAVLIFRKDLPTRFPKVWAAWQGLQGKIDDRTMIGLNVQAAVDHRPAPEIAAGFLAGETARPAQARPSFGHILFGGDFWPETGRHLELVFGSLALSILVGVPLGIWASRRPGSAGGILGTVGVIQTIPSLALFAFLIPLVHQIGVVPALIALFLYSLLPIVRNTYTGLTEIPPGLRESALALGLPAGARLRRVELPLAARSILAGIKTSAVINVGTATIAAFIGAGGYGERISEGLQTVDTPVLLAGAIPAAVLALLVQGLFDILERAVVPAGLRRS